MKEATIPELAYFMKEAKGEGKRAPIFFLGAGASKTGGIPLAGEIIKDILEQNADNPKISKLKEEEKTYAKLMDCLSPHGRNSLLKKYINDAKINVTHIYLANLLVNDFADYVLTVNFDNLMLRALALFSEFPPTYDMAVLKDLTTTAFKEKSVVYLHGQHHGLWLLNTKEEMSKVKKIIPKIIDSIKSERPWVFIGYSGQDPIFKHLLELGRFDNELYWVGYNDHDPCDAVCQELLNAPNKNASIIRGYDSDAFMLKLNTELGLEQPDIMSRPFSSLKTQLDKIVDIDDQEHFKGVKKRLEMSKKEVDQAIQQFELVELESVEQPKVDMEIDKLKKEIIGLLLKSEFDEEKIEELTVEADGVKDAEANGLLAGLYSNWGYFLGVTAGTEIEDAAENLYGEAFEKFSKSIKDKSRQLSGLLQLGNLSWKTSQNKNRR